MSKDNAVLSNSNPLLGIRVGSTIVGNTGTFSPSVIIENISRMIPAKEVQKSMTGQSSYVYTDQLNQGSLGASGSYGVSGVSKLSSSLSGYVGKASASSTKSITVNYNVSMLSGIEYIDFDDLTAADIVNSLKNGPKELALDVLDKFNAVNQKMQGTDALSRYVAGELDGDTKELLKQWVTALQEFVKVYGDGVVVGVIWGGMGSVSMEMTNSQSENNWKYGGQGSFSYSGVGASVSVQATYDGSQSTRESGVSATCVSSASGDCVTKQIDEWFNVVAEKAFSEIADIKLLERAPTVSSVEKGPSIPDFQKPAGKEKVTDKVKELGDLNSLNTFATASAYEKAKADNEGLTFKEFMENANQKASNNKVDELRQQVQKNDIDVLEEGKEEAAAPLQVSQLMTRGGVVQDLAEDERKLVLGDIESDYAVLGAWIANWSDIFPWMATGYLNEITNTDFAQKILRKQCMVQDFLALSKLYYTLASCQIGDLSGIGIDSPMQIADSFGQQLSYLQQNLGDDNAIQLAHDKLSDDAKKIYQRWNTIKFLRSAELGLGLLYEGKTSVTEIVKDQGPKPFVHVSYKTGSCSFGSNNYSAFSSFLKLLPVISPNGKIYAFGPSNMLLKSSDQNAITFTKGSLLAMELTVNKYQELLENGDTKLYPIPFSAADNIQWKGQNLSTNLSSIKHINDHLTALSKELAKLNVCTFSSNDWDENWNYKRFYNLRSLKTQYIGLVDAVGNVFTPTK